MTAYVNQKHIVTAVDVDVFSNNCGILLLTEHILTQNEAITLVTELTDQDYVEQYLNNEGAQGLFEALDLLKDQGWVSFDPNILQSSMYIIVNQQNLKVTHDYHMHDRIDGTINEY